MHKQCSECSREFEAAVGPGRPAMTCSRTCQTTRKSRMSQQSRVRAFNRECPPEKHGTATGYTFYGCGCTRCTRWARLDKQERRANAKAHGHG